MKKKRTFYDWLKISILSYSMVGLLLVLSLVIKDDPVGAQVVLLVVIVINTTAIVGGSFGGK